MRDKFGGIDMRFIANIDARQYDNSLFESDCVAHLTHTNSGWLLSLIMRIRGRRLVGGHLVTKDQTMAGESAICNRLQHVVERLAFSDSEFADVGAHLREAIRVFEQRLRHDRSARPSMLSARQLRIATGLLGASLSISQVALACGVSEGHLRRGFRTCTGVSPSKWRQERRLHFCRQQLIETNAPLSTIARRGGFSVQSHFSRVFTESSDMSPTEWRHLFQTATRAGAPVFEQTLA
jgi:AraC-like DNA-binding protein